MSKSIRWLLTLLVPLGLFVGGGAASMTVVATVSDDGGYFSADAINKANGVVKDIYDKYHRDLLIETYKTVPADRADQLKKIEAMTDEDAKKKARKEFFNKWAIDQARAREVEGIYILACRQPPHIEIEVKKNVQKEFPNEDYRKLEGILVDNFRKASQSKDETEARKLYDQGLIGAVEFVRDTFKTTIGNKSELAPGVPEERHRRAAEGEHHGGTSFFSGAGLLGLLCPILGFGLLIWLIIGVVRAITGSGRQNYGPPGPGGAPGYGPGPGYGAPGYGGGGGGGGGFMTEPGGRPVRSGGRQLDVRSLLPRRQRRRFRQQQLGQFDAVQSLFAARHEQREQ